MYIQNRSIVCLVSLLCCLNMIVASDSIPTELIDIAYLSPQETEVDSLQKLNLVIPDVPNKPPLFIWIGGGAWSYVDRHMEMDFARQIADQGIAVASVGHRLSNAPWRFPDRTDGVQHPEHARDVAKACKYLVDHAGDYGYDTSRIVIGGFSSGAHLSTILILNPSLLREAGLEKSNFKGVVPVSGGYDILQYYNTFLNSEDSKHLAEQHVQDVFGSTEAEMLEASPTTYLDELEIPMLMLSDNNTYQYTAPFESKIREETDFLDFQVLHAHTYDHGGLWRHLSFDDHSLIRNHIVDFIYKSTE